MDIMSTIRESLGIVGRETAKTAKKTAEIVKLRDKIRRDKKQIKALTYKIGETYLMNHATDYEEDYAEFFVSIEALKDSIAKTEQELYDLKNDEITAPYEEVDFAQEENEDAEAIVSDDFAADAAETEEAAVDYDDPDGSDAEAEEFFEGAEEIIE